MLYGSMEGVGFIVHCQGDQAPYRLTLKIQQSKQPIPSTATHLGLNGFYCRIVQRHPLQVECREPLQGCVTLEIPLAGAPFLGDPQHQATLIDKKNNRLILKIPSLK